MKEFSRFNPLSAEIETFWKVSGCPTFVEAAVQLNTTQSNVSKSIAKLESSLDAKLFLRSRQGVRLTREGQALLERIKQLKGTWLSAAPAAAMQASLIRVGFHPVLGLEYWPRVLEKLGGFRADVEYQVRFGRSKEIFSQLMNGDLDVALVAGPVAKLPNVFSRKIAEEHLLLCQSAHGPGETLIYNPNMINSASVLRSIKTRKRLELADYELCAATCSSVPSRTVLPSPVLDRWKGLVVERRLKTSIPISVIVNLRTRDAQALVRLLRA